jgi:hypothetical protein
VSQLLHVAPVKPVRHAQLHAAGAPVTADAWPLQITPTLQTAHDGYPKKPAAHALQVAPV